MVTDLAERRNLKLNTVSGVSARNHVFCTTKLQKAPRIGDNRYAPEVPKVETVVL